MKRLSHYLFATLLLVGFAACSDDNGGSSPEGWNIRLTTQIPDDNTQINMDICGSAV